MEEKKKDWKGDDRRASYTLFASVKSLWLVWQVEQLLVSSGTWIKHSLRVFTRRLREGGEKGKKEKWGNRQLAKKKRRLPSETCYGTDSRKKRSHLEPAYSISCVCVSMETSMTCQLKCGKWTENLFLFFRSRRVARSCFFSLYF